MATDSFRALTGSAPTGAAFVAALLVLGACAVEPSGASLRLRLLEGDGTGRSIESARSFGALAPAVAPVAADSVGTTLRRVAVLVADADDERIAVVGEAVSFWNRAVSNLGLAGPFSEPGDQAPPEGLRPFENYAHQLSQLAGRLHASDPGPRPPEALLRVDAEVVVLLSAQNLMPFAWSYGDDGRYFVAIPFGDGREHVVRNVIAHELGHVLGLKHTREPGVLMCQPCDMSARTAGQPRFLPLTELDRERLRSFLGGTGP